VSAGRTANATIAGVSVGIDQTGASAPSPTPPVPTPPVPTPPDPSPPGPPPPPPPPPPPAPDPPPQPAPGCAYTVSPTEKSTAATGEGFTVSVTTPAGCDWTASSAASWITVDSGAPGRGNGSVRLVVAPSTGPARTGIVTVAGRQVRVEQQAAPVPACSYSIDPTSRTAGPGRSDVDVDVKTASGCAWTAVSSQAWIAVADGSGGAGNGHVHLTVDANTTMAMRTGTVAIAGQTFTVQQAGIDCKYDIKPDLYDAGPGPDDVRIDVKAAPGCTWTTMSSALWVTIVEGSTGSGSGSVRLLVQPNIGDKRETIITIAGRELKLKQKGS